MAVLTRIAPWILFGVGQLFLGREWASPLAALAALAIVIARLVTRHSPKELILDLSTLVYFIGFSVLVFAAPHSEAVQYVAAGAQLFQGVVVGAFMLAHLPFTLPIARRTVPDEIAETEPFYKFNVKLSSVWLIAFLLSGAVLVVMVAMNYREVAPQIGVIAAAIVIPVLIQNRMVGEVT